jgi:plasmid stabilization system protein ParE
MAYSLELVELAELDIDNAIEWYESKLSGLGDQLLVELRSTLRAIQDNPEAFQVRRKGIYRECPLTRFPYLIVYRIEAKRIVVLSVFNTHQNPFKKPQ